MIIFGLGVIVLYTLLSRYYIPELTPEPPPEKLLVNPAEMSVEEIIAYGERTYKVKGRCVRCHNLAGKRAPRIERVALYGSDTIKKPSYTGRAKSAGEYIYESMVEPSTHVVSGYGAQGEDGEGGKMRSPMPGATGRVVGLSEFEVRAVIAYLQHSAGALVEIPNFLESEKGKEK